MVKRNPDAEGISVVLVGSFNPGIFHPEWFRRQGLLLSAEAEAAKVRFVTPDATEISFVDMQLDVLPNRFMLRTSDASRADKLHDIALGVLERLNHTPVTACGINNELDFDLGDEAYCHKIGHTLAPKEPVWNNVLPAPGMQSLTIKAVRAGGFPGFINVLVQPSPRFRYGLFVSSNYHYDVPLDEAKTPRPGLAVKYLTDEWKVALDQARLVAYRIFEAIPKDAH